MEVIWSAMIVHSKEVSSRPAGTVQRARSASARCVSHCTSGNKFLDKASSRGGRACIKSVSNHSQATSLTPLFADRPKEASGITWCRHMTSPRISPRERAFPLALPPSPFIRDIDRSLPSHRAGTPFQHGHRQFRPLQSYHD